MATSANLTGDNMDAILLASGPSAKLWDQERAYYYICAVNGAIELVKDKGNIDLYCVFENVGVRMYKDWLLKMGRHSYMKLENYTSTWRTQFVGGIIPPVSVIAEDFGPEPLRHLLPDRQYPSGKETWISSGVMAMWVLAETRNVQKITVYGMDGYRHGNDYEESIAPDIQRRLLANTYREQREHPNELKDDVWKQRMNVHMSEAIEAITNYYNGIEFVWARKPLHYSDKWKVSFLGE